MDFLFNMKIIIHYFLNKLTINFIKYRFIEFFNLLIIYFFRIPIIQEV